VTGRVRTLTVGPWVYEYGTAWTVRSTNPQCVGTGTPTERELLLLELLLAAAIGAAAPTERDEARGQA